ncbi:MAG: hypothetical protein AAFY11_01960 [Cyanobacteria bacterium J06641_5]
MSKLLAMGVGLGIGVSGLLVAEAIAPLTPSARAQTTIVGSPIPSPIPVNPITGHGLRNTRTPSVRGRRTIVPRYPVYSGRSSKAPVRTTTVPRARVVRDGIGQPFVVINSDRVRVIQDRFGNDVFILDTGRGRVVNIR